MADVQKQFRKFNDNIKLEAENKNLREKRDKILKTLRDALKKRREDGEKIPSFETRNQGSYAMGTGIRPLDDDYDIDVAVLFDLDKDDHSDPLEVKKWVYEGVKHQTTKVDVKGPCVTVTYMAKGEPKFHVDLAVYANGCADGQTYLARGKLHSSTDKKSWDPSDPEALVKAIDGRFEGEAKEQFRRCIRYLKRWKEQRWSSSEGGKPTGIGFTAAAYQWFSPVLGGDGADDLAALQSLVASILAGFTAAIDGEVGRYHELAVALPVHPGNDLFEEFTPRQLETLYERLSALDAALRDAKASDDVRDACEILEGVFGDDFPVPEESKLTDEERRRRNALRGVVASTQSAPKPYYPRD